MYKKQAKNLRNDRLSEQLDKNEIIEFQSHCRYQTGHAERHASGVLVQ